MVSGRCSIVVERRALSRDEVIELLSNPLMRDFVENNVAEFQVSVFPPDVLESFDAYLWFITVSRKSFGRWAVGDRMDVFDVDGVAEYESLPSERTEAFKARFRHDLLTAVDLAFKIAADVKIGGRTPEQFTEWYRAKVAERDEEVMMEEKPVIKPKPGEWLTEEVAAEIEAAGKGPSTTVTPNDVKEFLRKKNP